MKTSSQNTIKLFELPNTRDGMKIYGEASDGSGWFTFYHVDGMYSYCITEKGNVSNLSAFAEIKKAGDMYMLAE